MYYQWILPSKRSVLIFLFAFVVLQAIYYIATLHMKWKFTWSSFGYEFKSDENKIQLVRDSKIFINSSFLSSNVFVQADPSSSTLCQFSLTRNDTSWYQVKLNQTIVSYDTIEQSLTTDLHPGGHWFPPDCRSEQRLAIIICYRNRESHWKLFLNNIHRFLQRQLLDYTIFLVNQHGQEQFNRAALFNVGFVEARKFYPFDCFIFHDVDLLPEDLRNVYRCGENPRHMSVAVDKFNYRLLYPTLFGGVTAFHISDFVATNGYPTIYWGWGGEDDDMYLRVKKRLNKTISRYPMEIARYKMIRSMNHTSGQVNPHRHEILYSNYKYENDGINTIQYQLHQIVFYRLFTLINVTLHEESFEEIHRRLNFTQRTKKKKKS